MKHLFLGITCLYVLISCGKDQDNAPPITLDQDQLELHYDQTHQFKLKQGTGELKASQYRWTSSNEYVGTVYDGDFKAEQIGETTITASSKDGKKQWTSKVTVVPYSTLYREPVTDFSLTPEQVKSKETREVREQSATVTTYKGENSKTWAIRYNFTAGKLSSATVLLMDSQDIANEGSRFLDERYKYVGEFNGASVFTDEKTVTIRYQYTNDYGLMVQYSPYVKGGRLPGSSISEK